ncbi:carbohydrate-binding protein [Nonomuraea sp. NPDC004186]
MNVGFIENGDYIKVKGVAFGNGASSFTARVASGTSGGRIELRLGSVTGTLVGTCAVTGTGGWQTWTSVTCPVSGATGTRDLYLRFAGDSGYLLNLNWRQVTPSGNGGGNLLTNGTMDKGTTGWTASRRHPVHRRRARRQPFPAQLRAYRSLERPQPERDRTAHQRQELHHERLGAVAERNPQREGDPRRHSQRHNELPPVDLGANGRHEQLDPAHRHNDCLLDGTLTNASFHVETATGTDGLYIDDASFQ